MVRYEFPILSDYTGAAQFNVNYTGDQSLTLIGSADEQEKTYAVGDLRLSIASRSGNWEGALFIKNLWDTRYRMFAFDLSSLGTITQVYNRPRTIGFSFRRAFQ